MLHSTSININKSQNKCGAGCGAEKELLTDTKARKCKAGDKPVSVGGVPGLRFEPSSQNGRGKFTLRFVSPETRKRRDMGLGTYPHVSIAQARATALQYKALIADGIDPIDQRERDARIQEQENNIPTFATACEKVFADISPAFKNNKHKQQWINTLRSYAIPKIGNVTVDQLRIADFADALRPIWLTKPETASRLKQRCERVMLWCIAQGYIEHNPVSSVSALLPKQPKKRDRVQHFPAVAWRDLPSAAKQLFQADNMTCGKQALLFLILTAARSGEVRGATWDEIDFPNNVWSIPAHRTKTGKPHNVPLSPPALNLLKHRKPFAHEGPLVFSKSGRSPLSDMTLSKILRDSKIASDTAQRFATVHGFRSSFRDWASENGYARDLAERALAHAIKSETESAYHRTDLLEQRRDMMENWGSFALKQSIISL
ncbi:tyrosine-type recombinase/integrase [Paramylibacter ulvae]|nr:site-specific integrase [Amylibacter ulvae]